MRSKNKSNGLEFDKLLQEDFPECFSAALKKYANIFPEDLSTGVPPVRQGHEFRIDLEDEETPIHKPIYKLSPRELGECKTQSTYMLEHGFMQSSDSPYSPLVLLVPNKDGGLLFYIDDRWLNNKTVKNRLP